MISPDLRRGIARAVRPHSIFAGDTPTQGLRASFSDLADRVAVRAGRTQRRGRQLQFEYRGYLIPVDLAEMTGGGADSWEEISLGHMDCNDRWAPIEPDHRVLELGCGIGRDAIHLADVLSSDGSYVGIDIVGPSIRWAERKITARHPNVRFVLLDVHSDMYNPGGLSDAAMVVLPVASDRFDRVILHSVFTHMFHDDVANYLREFARVLRPGGTVLASFFIADPEVLAARREMTDELTFDHAWDDHCFVQDPHHPEGAVAYNRDSIDELIAGSGLDLVGVHPGFWRPGSTPVPNGQDVVVLSRSSAP